MNWLPTTLVLSGAFLAVFFQSSFAELPRLVGAQVNLLPGLVVYASLTCGISTLAAVAALGALWFDALSANPLGVSILPLFIPGLILHRYRSLILRDEAFAQLLLGMGASAATPLLTLVLLINVDRQPVLGWFSLWQWVVMTVLGGVATPLWFWLFDRVDHAFSYRPLAESSFRPDREIKRGRA